MLNYTEVTAATGSAEKNELLIAALADAGFEGFEERSNELLAFIPSGNFNPEVLEAIMHLHAVQYTIAIIEQKNWNELWEASFEPVQVGDFCIIRAGFHTAQPGFRHEIVITPKMSFGTGHHATTYMMIERLQELSCAGRRVLDFGTGTGILAILAEKLGASEVDAIDVDEWSIANAQENLLLNGSQSIRLHQADTLSLLGMYDIILANINKNVILDNMDSMHEHLYPDGTVVLSGLLMQDYDEVREAALAAGLLCKSMHDRNSWISMTLVNR